MGIIMRNNIAYSGGGGSETVELSMAEYEAREAAGAIDSDTWYLIYDANDSYNAKKIVYDNAESGMEASTVQGAIDELNSNIDEQNKNLSNRIGFIDTSRVLATLTVGQHTVTEDCWCIGSFNASFGEWAYIALDGIYVASVMGTDQDKKQEPTCCFPVRKGQVVSVRDGSAYSYTLKFYPMITQ